MMVVLFLFIICLAIPGPSNQDIQDACANHGRVVSYNDQSLFAIDADPRAVCSDGTVHKVKW